MNVLLIGANGQIGKHIIQLAKDEADISLTAMVRKEEQLDELTANGTDAVLANLEGSVADLEKAIDGADTVIFTAGSGGHTGADKTILVDLDGAVKAVEAAENAGVERFIMVSAFQAQNREAWAESPIKHYMAAKHYADRFLLDSKLKHTIIRPGRLENEAGTGKIQAGDLKEYGAIAREDVAKTVIASLKNKNTENTSFDIISGKQSIEDAIKNL
ncbi:MULTISPECIES: SDR family oxidoreductase [unclassified Oceanobacillus]|uniref:SDR family oxidoreductase n=1 Tax=unclassified Oceanobacillus TaxID=2630292 RepID=UPI00300DEA7A